MYSSTVILLLVGVLEPASGAARGQPQFPLAVSPGFQWAHQQEMHIAGIPVQLRSFTATMSLRQATAALAANTSHFQKVLASAQLVLLSGVHDGRQWVAQVNAQGKGARGLVSSIPLQHPKGMQNPHQSPSVLPWLKGRATLRFAARTSERGHEVTQEVHQAQLGADDLMAYVRAELRRAGWQQDMALPWMPGATAWRHQGATLVLLTQSGSEGSRLFVHHRQ